MVTLHMTEEEFKSLYYGISNRNTAHIKHAVKQLVSDMANSIGIKKANGDNFWKEQKKMDAIQTVHDMYTRLEEEVNLKCLIRATKQHNFDGFSIVNCVDYSGEGFEEPFDLIVLEDGKILNCNGDNVYDILYEAYRSHNVNRCYSCPECGTWAQVEVPEDDADCIACHGCGMIIPLKEVE